MSSWWSWCSLFSSLGNGGGSNANTSSGSGTSSSPVVLQPQQAAAGAPRRAHTKKPREGGPANAKAQAKPSQSQPQPTPRKNRPSPRKATPKASKAKARLQLGDGEPKKKPAPTPSQKRNNKRKQVAAFERSWSRANKLRIPRAMANHANNHHGALPDTHNLFAALASCLDRRDADLPNLVDKVHKLKIWYDNACLHQCSSTDDDGTCRLMDHGAAPGGPDRHDDGSTACCT
uniref:Glabrous enhancer-binding protein-like DBD domain-containing protein n=1 Tax=Oryza nivara TaxID=4536 RepID=A0A0E0FUL1_ORYNI